MQRNLSFLLAAGLLFSVAVLGWNQSGRAAFCGKCRDLMFIDSEGKCIDCGGPTASAALRLCPKCSARRHQCEHCLAATTEKDEPASQGKPADPAPEQPRDSDSHGGAAQNSDAQGKPPQAWTTPANNGSPAKPDETAVQPTDPEINALRSAARAEKPAPLDFLPESKPPAVLPPDPTVPPRLKPINPAKAGTYTWEKWRYQLQIIGAGTRAEGRWGWLTFDGQKLPRGEVNDYYNTPWGPIYWVDVPATAWGVHGWMPVPLTQNRRQGRALPPPRGDLSTASTQPATAARTGVSPAPAGAVAPTRPRAGMLEINKSHIGQVARLRVGHILVIRLPGNPATGYQWQAATTNSPAVRLTVRPQYSAPQLAAMGSAASGTYTFTFQAVQPGTGSLRLYYVRPNDPTRPRDSFAIGVSVSPTATAATTVPAANRGNERW